MGQEARCTVRFGDRVSVGKALLESEELLFRGEFRLAIPLGEVRSVDTSGGHLTLIFGAGSATFELGPLAEQWAQRVRNPRTLLDKLGVKPGQRVAIVGLADEDFRARLAASGVELSAEQPAPDTDLIFYLAERPEDLDALAELRHALKSNGGIWVVSPRGRPAIKDVVIMAAARQAGLVDVKVAAFSKTHTALKLVIPRAQR
jgi:DUF3052 family protein